MKTINRILALTLVFILTIGVSGCMGPFQSNKSRMLKHLKEKYNGQEFVPIRMDVGGGDWFGGGVPVLYCYPKGGDPEVDEVEVVMAKNSDGKNEFSDTYFGTLIREELEAELLVACLEVCSDSPLPMKARFRSDLADFDESFDCTKTYADFKEWQSETKEPVWLDISVVVFMDGTDISEKKAYAKPIIDKFEEDSFFRGGISVLFLPTEALEKKIPIDNIAFNKLATQYRNEYANISKYSYDSES